MIHLPPLTQTPESALSVLSRGIDFTSVPCCLRKACEALGEWEEFAMVMSVDFQVCVAAAKQIIWQVERESVCTWITKQGTSISALGTKKLFKKMHLWIEFQTRRV